jgi:hypothetical protein
LTAVRAEASQTNSKGAPVYIAWPVIPHSENPVYQAA